MVSWWNLMTTRCLDKIFGRLMVDHIFRRLKVSTWWNLMTSHGEMKSYDVLWCLDVLRQLIVSKVILEEILGHFYTENVFVFLLRISRSSTIFFSEHNRLNEPWMVRFHHRLWSESGLTVSDHLNSPEDFANSLLKVNAYVWVFIMYRVWKIY